MQTEKKKKRMPKQNMQTKKMAKHKNEKEIKERVIKKLTWDWIQKGPKAPWAYDRSSQWGYNMEPSPTPSLIPFLLPLMK